MQIKQRTLKSEVNISGTGLHTGLDVTINIKPAPANSGIQFQRVDLDKKPVIKALADYVTDTSRGTTIEKDGVRISTIEHLMAALYGLGIDNALIEIDAPEVPIIDGSSKPFIEVLKKSGVEDQDADRVYFEIKRKFEYRDEAHGIEIVAYPDDHFSVDVHIAYNTKVLSNQYATFHDGMEFEKELAHCKTFVFLGELEPLFRNNLIKGGDLDNAIIFIDKDYTQEYFDNLAVLFNKPKVEVKPEGILNNVDLIYDNEPARHKLLDVIGDVSLAGMPIKGKIIATRPGHKANTDFARILRQEIKSNLHKAVPPHIDPNEKPVLDISGIQKLLPHRSPFLLIDKITHLDSQMVTGIKNVTMNESYFIGHFPEEAIMPGVLQVEAMAQCGAVLLLNLVDNPKDYLTLFLKIENIKFKNKVVPGDTLNIKMVLLEPIKRGIAITKGQAFVGDKLVIEGEFMAQLSKKPNL